MASRKSLIVSILMVLGVAGFIVGIVWVNYDAHTKLQSLSFKRFEERAWRYSSSLNYFIDDRKEDLVGLTKSQEVNTYFRSLDMKMSEEYGLSVSLKKVTELLRNYVALKSFGGVPVFSRIMFVDLKARLLADSDSLRWDREDSFQEKNDHVISDMLLEGVNLIEQQGKTLFIINQPVMYRGQVSGFMLAWVNPDSLCKLLPSEEVLKAGSEHVSLRFNGHRVWCLGHTLPGHLNKIEVAALEQNEIIPITIKDGNDSRSRYLVIKAPIGETPLSILTVVDEVVVAGKITPQVKALLSATIGAAVFFGTILMLFFLIKNLMLREHIQKALLREKEVEAKNVQLQHEIQARQEAVKKLIEAKEAAVIANRAKSEFLANMSHEIRTPMNGILGMIQLLQTTTLNEEQQEYTKMAIQSSRRLAGLLSDILDLSKVEAGKLTINNEPFDLQELLQHVNELFHPVADQASLKTNIIIHPDTPKTVHGDSTRLQQVLTNFLGNAIKFTPSGSVTLTVTPLPYNSEDHFKILFQIADTGIGIPDDKLGTLFAPFTQASEGFTRSYQGAGLGLSICKQLVKLMGGAICIDSEVEKGTTIYFTIAFYHENEVSTGSSPEPSVQTVNPHNLVTPPTRIIRILLAEDDKTSSFTTTKQLKIMGHEVTAVTDGDQAIEALKQNDFDVVFMDVQMPIMNGVEATLAIRNGKAGEKNKQIPIVALTAYAMNGDRENFLGIGMNDYLAKPVEMDSLKVVLENLVYSKK